MSKYNKEYQKNYYKKNREKILKRCSEYAKENPDKRKQKNRLYSVNNMAKILFTAARNRSKDNNLEFSIDISDIIIPEKCPIFGVKLVKGYNGNRNNSPSLDRIDNTKGYIKGNIIVVSFKVNRYKSDASINELEKIVKFYKKLKV